VKRDLDRHSVIIRDILDDELDRVENHHETRSSVLEILSNALFEFLDFDS
jgi:hypothetical protein